MDELDERCRRKMLTRLLAKATVTEENLAHLAAATEHFTGAQMQEIVNTIYMLSVEQQKASGTVQPPATLKVEATRELIDQAIEEVRLARRSDLGFRSRLAKE